MGSVSAHVRTLVHHRITLPTCVLQRFWCFWVCWVSFWHPECFLLLRQLSHTVTDVFQEKAAEVLRTYRSSDLACSSLLSFVDLGALCSGVCSDEGTLCMALLQLQKDKQVMVSLHDGEKVRCCCPAVVSPVRTNTCRAMTRVLWQIVKFRQPGQDRVSPVSDVDIGIYQLQRSEKLLGERVEKLGAEADRYANSSSNYEYNEYFLMCGVTLY